MKRSKLVALFLIGSLSVSACTACEEKQETTASRSSESVSITEPIDSVPSTSEVETTPTEEDTSWHYGTVQRPTSKEEKRLYFFQVPVESTDTSAIGEIGGSNQEEKLSDAINQELKDIKYGEWNHVGAAALEKIYTHHDVSVAEPYCYVVNNILSVSIRRWDDFTSSSDDYGEYFETMYYSNYNIVTGERMQLKDIFYEDTDYVSLLNGIINEWLLEHNDLEQTILFTGIQEDQQFSIEEDGSLNIYIDDGVYVTLSPFDVMEMTALADAVQVDETTQERIHFLPSFSEGYVDWNEFKVCDRCEFTNFRGLEGVSEERIVGYLCEVPDEVHRFLLQEELMQTDTEEIRAAKDTLDELGVTCSMSTFFTVDQIGEVYVVSSMIFTRMDDSIFGEQLSDEEVSAVYDALDKIIWGMDDTYIFDQSGKLIQVEDLFKDDVDLRQVLTDALKSGKANWMMSWSVNDYVYDLLESMEYDDLYELVQKASLAYTKYGIEIRFQDDPAYAEVTRSIYSIGWDELVAYMKE
ncbi:MAG: hypothetical protein KBT07_02310 [Clostridiales bacterium]|nr:hypothetical protein [Candidatus Scatonaster coprocaballi]